MSEKAANWKYADDYSVEPDAIAFARRNAAELGIDAVSPSVGSQLAVLAAASRARAVVEIGTGTGVSGLWLLAGSPTATLTTIDSEPDHQAAARAAFAEAGVSSGRVRLITGRALDVLPRMNEESYDLVLVDGNPDSVIEYVEHGLRLVRAGGLVLVAGALGNGDVANPARRDKVSTAYRSLLEEIGGSTAALSTLSPAGGGLLQLVRW